MILWLIHTFKILMHLVSILIGWTYQFIHSPLDPDPNMTIETYDRTWEQNEDLGLNDIKVEGYEEDAGETETNESTKI